MLKETVDFLGLIVKDKITGATGVAESVCFDLYGCVQVAIKPRGMDKDGKPQDGRWYDVNRIEVLGEARVMPVPLFAAMDSRPANYDHGPADKPARPQTAAR